MVIMYILNIKTLLILYPVQAICLFLIANGCICKGLNTKITKELSNLSCAIYFLHTVFIYGVVDNFFGISSSVILKFVISITMSIIVYLITWKIKSVRWLLGVNNK